MKMYKHVKQSVETFACVYIGIFKCFHPIYKSIIYQVISGHKYFEGKSSLYLENTD